MESIESIDSWSDFHHEIMTLRESEEELWKIIQLLMQRLSSNKERIVEIFPLSVPRKTDDIWNFPILKRWFKTILHHVKESDAVLTPNSLKTWLQYSIPVHLDVSSWVVKLICQQRHNFTPDRLTIYQLELYLDSISIYDESKHIKKGYACSLSWFVKFFQLEAWHKVSNERLIQKLGRIFTSLRFSSYVMPESIEKMIKHWFTLCPERTRYIPGTFKDEPPEKYCDCFSGVLMKEPIMIHTTDQQLYYVDKINLPFLKGKNPYTKQKLSRLKVDKSLKQEIESWVDSNM